MKIGIITLPLNFNYGGLLQAFALQKILRDMGHQPVCIDRPLYPKVSIDWTSIYSWYNLVCKYILHTKPYISFDKYLYDTYPIVTQYTEPFIKKYIERVSVSDFGCLSEDDFDMLMCGSDQIWRRKFHKKETDVYNSFLLFAKNWSVKRVSYAASFGSDEWEYNQHETKVCKKLISLFDAVSVREISGVELCKSHFNISAMHVLDPTLLLSAEDYIRILGITDYPKPSGNLLTYILDENDIKCNIVEKIEKEKKLKSFVVNSKAEDYRSKIENRIQPSVESWLKGFYDADFVITDSFHACVFSILFKKQFAVIINKRRGASRIVSLLGLLDLEDRILDEDEWNDKLLKLKEVDYNFIEPQLDNLRHNSIAFLKKALS